MALQNLGFELGQYVEQVQPVKERSSHIQTAAQVVMTLAAVFALLAQSKDPRLAWALVSVIGIIFVAIYGSRLIAFLRVRTHQATQDKMARTNHKELLRFARRFTEFNASSNWSNLRFVISSAYGNDESKCAQVCPPDFMHDLWPLFLRHFETPPIKERQFILATQEFNGIVASYNKEYVIEPFRKMRLKQWYPASPSELVPEAVAWIESVPANSREAVARQIEDFRERWASFLDSVNEWLEKMHDSFGVNGPTPFRATPKAAERLSLIEVTCHERE